MKKFLVLFILIPISVSAWWNPFTNKESIFGAPTGSYYYANLLKFSTTTTGCLNGKTTASGVVTAYFTGSDCGSGSGSSFAWPFTVNTGYNSTTTVLGLNGFFSTASSTLSGDTYLPSLSQGFAYTGTAGKINTIASSSVKLSWFNNDSGFLTSATGLTSYDAWTHPAAGYSATTSALAIATTSSWAKLSVSSYSSGANTNPLFVVASSTGTGATSTAFIINSIGNVGIGTASPTVPLHILTAANSTGMKLDAGGGNNYFDLTTNGGLRITSNGNYATGPSFQIWPTGTTWQGMYFDAGSAAGADLFFRSSPEGSNALVIKQGTGKAGFGSESNPASTVGIKGNLSVGSSYSSTAAPTDGAIFQGNIGIGSTTPNNKLDVMGSGYISSSLFVGGAITATSTLDLTSLSQGFAYLGTGSRVNSIASSSVKLSWFNNDSGFLTSATGLTSYDAWTHPAAGQSATTSLMQLFGNASTTQLTATSSIYLATEGGGVSVGTTSAPYKLTVNVGATTGGVIYEDGSNVLDGNLIEAFPAVLTIRTKNANTYWNLAYISGTNRVANYLNNGANLGFDHEEGGVYLGDNTFLKNGGLAFANQAVNNSIYGIWSAGANNISIGSMAARNIINGIPSLSIDTNSKLITFPYSSSTIYSSFATASTTNLIVSATTTTKGLSVVGAVSMMGEYFTNFTTYVRSLFSNGSHITITNGSVAVNDDFLLNNGDTGTGTYDFSGATVKQHLYPAFSYATSTAWTGTTTIYLAPSYQAETWNGVKCETDAGTVNVSFYDGTNRMNMLNASTTIGTFTLSTNNSFTAGETRRVDIGTPATSPTKISCSVDKTIN